jgi:peroxiredoxin
MIQIGGTPRQWALVAVLLAVLAGGLWFTLGGELPGQGEDVLREGRRAPAIELATLEGGTLSLAERRGAVVIVNLWASWCGPCRAEMPALERLYVAERARGLEILAVNSTVQDSPADARAFVEEHGLTFPILLDTNGAVSRAYRLRSLPSTYIIDRRGVIRQIFFGGPLSEETLANAVAPLLAEAP